MPVFTPILSIAFFFFFFWYFINKFTFFASVRQYLFNHSWNNSSENIAVTSKLYLATLRGQLEHIGEYLDS